VERLDQIERLWGNPKLSPEPLLSDVRWLTDEVRLLRTTVEQLHGQKKSLVEQLSRAAAQNTRLKQRISKSPRGRQSGAG